MRWGVRSMVLESLQDFLPLVTVAVMIIPCNKVSCAGKPRSTSPKASTIRLPDRATFRPDLIVNSNIPFEAKPFESVMIRACQNTESGLDGIRTTDALTI